MTTHSELPWKVDVEMDIVNKQDGHLATCVNVNQKANASFIVRACNNHEKLVEALQLILPLAKGYVSKNSVGSNQKYIEVADQAIQSVEEER